MRTTRAVASEFHFGVSKALVMKSQYQSPCTLKICSGEFPVWHDPVFGSTGSQLFNGLNALCSWLAGLLSVAFRRPAVIFENSDVGTISSLWVVEK